MGLLYKILCVLSNFYNHQETLIRTLYEIYIRLKRE